MIRLRMFLLASVLIAGFGGVLFRAFQLQILPTDKVARLARRQLSKKIEILGRRGVVTDRNGRELAVSTNTLSVFANPQLVKNPARVSRVLGPLLGVSEGSLRTRLSDASEKKFIWLARQLSPKQMALLEDIDMKSLGGVGLLPEFRREYPQGTLAAHILGFTSVDGDGIDGIEKQFDEQLRGDKNLIELKRDALGRPIFTQSEQIRLELNQGQDLELTIDSNLQYTAERALKEAVESHGAQAGTAIVMDPRTGEVLSLANFPTFDPNAPGSSPPAYRRDRAITDPIEPGSVVKPFVVARAIDDNIVRPDSVISGGDGFIKIGRKTIGEAEKKHRFKFLSITDLIRVSSNVGTVVLEQKMGWERIEDTFRKLGFGAPLGIELGGESGGIFKSPGPRQLLERATMSFGQGIALTPLQIATAFSVLANGGHKVRPKIIRSAGGIALNQMGADEKVFSESTAAKMRTILEKVVEGEGTGTLARIESFSVAGKTGTAQKTDYQRGGYQHGAYWSSFAGFVPSRAPRFVIYVMIDNPTQGGFYGGSVAAPVFAKIARTALQLVTPQAGPNPRRAAKLAPVAQSTPLLPAAVSAAVLPVASVSTTIPDVTGMSVTQAMRVLQTNGLKMELMGEGDRVAEQLPAAGAKVDAEKKVYIRLR